MTVFDFIKVMDTSVTVGIEMKVSDALKMNAKIKVEQLLDEQNAGILEKEVIRVSEVHGTVTLGINYENAAKLPEKKQEQQPAEAKMIGTRMQEEVLAKAIQQDSTTMQFMRENGENLKKFVERWHYAMKDGNREELARCEAIWRTKQRSIATRLKKKYIHVQTSDGFYGLAAENDTTDWLFVLREWR